MAIAWEADFSPEIAMPPHAEAAVTGGAESISRGFADVVAICRAEPPCRRAAATDLWPGNRAVVICTATFCAEEMEIGRRRAIVAEVAAESIHDGAARRSVSAPKTESGIGTAAARRRRGICVGPG